tara:strand:- start:4394 stop:5275 length:882 start_codon:yes stop_codon:yes gene_type:complete
MRILVSGGTGFIGRPLVKALQEAGHDVVVLTRQSALVTSDKHYIVSINALDACPDAWINLAGAGLADKRWTPKYLQEIRESRIDLSRQITGFLLQREWIPEVVLSGSAIGFYGASETAVFNEDSPNGSGFSATLCHDWEVSVTPLADAGARLAWLRTGVVLDAGSGAYPQMTGSFKALAKTWLGSGKQWLSWIHRRDVVSAIVHLLNTPTLSGPVNLTAPGPVTHRGFADAVGKAKPTLLALGVPAPVIRMIVGGVADELLLVGQQVMPNKLEGSEFVFAYPSIDEAIAAIES